MKATRIRITLGLVAAVLGLGARPASADAVSPTGPTTASLCSGTTVRFTLGTATGACTGSSFSFNAQSSASGAPVCATISPPTLTGCRVNSSGFSFATTCTANNTNGDWILCMSANGTGFLSVPQGGVNCTASLLGQTCRAIAPADATSTEGVWSNAGSSATFTNQKLPTTTSGGFPCPSGTVTSFSATYCTNPALTLTHN